MEHKLYLIALNKIPSMGPAAIAKLCARWTDLTELGTLTLSQLEQAGLSSQVAHAIHQITLKDIESDLAWQEKNNHFLLSWDEEAYPSLLKEIANPPPVLYGIGDWTALNQVAIAIVGSRSPSILGHETAWHFSKELATNHLTLVSGLALGIDAQVHKGCIAGKGKTIAVMGTGIDLVYPRQHQALAEQIIHQNGLLLSEFPLKTPPMAAHFPRRNRIISGLSKATLVVEAAIKSGSLITAKFALEQNRDVLAIPGSILNPQARGCHLLLQQGATLVTSVEDIMNELGLQIKSNGLELQENKDTMSTLDNLTTNSLTTSESLTTLNCHTTSDNLTALASITTASITTADSIKRNNVFMRKTKPRLARGKENLVKCIGFEITTIDQISQRAGLNIDKVVGLLTALELQGIIKSVPGGYIRCLN